MSQTKKTIWQISLIAVALFFVQPCFAAHTSIAQRLRHLLSKIESTKVSLHTTQKKQSNIQHKLRSAEISLNNILIKNHRTKNAINKEQRTLKALDKKEDALTLLLQKQKLYLARLVKATYMLGDQQYLKIMLNEEDPSLFNRMLHYYQSLINARTKVIEKINETLEEISANRKKITDHTNLLKGLSKKQLRQRVELEKTKTARKHILVTLNKELHSKSSRLKSLMRDKANLERVIKRVSSKRTVASIRFAGKFAKLRHKLAWPVSGTIVDHFDRRISHSQLTTNGVLIAARAGTPVKAIANGSVVYANWLTGYGLLIIVDHGSGYMSLYGHNQTLYHKAGDQIRAGEVLANVGTSGGLTRPELYFAIRYRGKPVNPGIWCR